MSIEMKQLIIRKARIREFEPNKIIYRQGTKG